MSTTFVPALGEKAKPATLADNQIITNLPPFGTPIRATIGETVVYGTVNRASETYPVFYIDIEGRSAGLLDLAIWLRSGWNIEILSTPKPHTFEDTLAEVAAVSAHNNSEDAS
jgi:hypothetical protein